MHGVYVGPYYATVNGVANTPVICDDFADDSVIGHTWNFTANNFSTLGSALWGNQTQNYEAAAWLTIQMLSLNSNPNNATQVGYLSFAIWSLFDKNALNGLNSTQLAGVNILASQSSVEFDGESILQLCHIDAARLHQWPRLLPGTGILSGDA